MEYVQIFLCNLTLVGNQLGHTHTHSHSDISAAPRVTLNFT